MLDQGEIERLKHRFAREAHAAFARPEAPKYNFTVDDAIGSLFDLLRHGFGFDALQAVGESILAGFVAFEQTDDLTALLVKIEPFCRCCSG